MEQQACPYRCRLLSFDKREYMQIRYLNIAVPISKRRSRLLRCHWFQTIHCANPCFLPTLQPVIMPKVFIIFYLPICWLYLHEVLPTVTSFPAGPCSNPIHEGYLEHTKGNAHREQTPCESALHIIHIHDIPCSHGPKKGLSQVTNYTQTWILF